MLTLLSLALFATAAILLFISMGVLRHAMKERACARESFQWQRVPPDVRIATIAMALEEKIFPANDTSKTCVIADDAAAYNLRLVLRWCQSPLKVTPLDARQ